MPKWLPVAFALGVTQTLAYHYALTLGVWGTPVVIVCNFLILYALIQRHFFSAEWPHLSIFPGFAWIMGVDFGDALSGIPAPGSVAGLLLGTNHVATSFAVPEGVIMTAMFAFMLALMCTATVGILTDRKERDEMQGACT